MYQILDTQPYLNKNIGQTRHARGPVHKSSVSYRTNKFCIKFYINTGKLNLHYKIAQKFQMLQLLLQQNFQKYFMPWHERKNSCANNPVATEHKQYKCFSKKKNKNSSQPGLTTHKVNFDLKSIFLSQSEAKHCSTSSKVSQSLVF